MYAAPQSWAQMNRENEGNMNLILLRLPATLCVVASNSGHCRWIDHFRMLGDLFVRIEG